jgi:putative ubiquitin-RnfH superfamily antitoxin RatB of RatAB toxin-antitoxin module
MSNADCATLVAITLVHSPEPGEARELALTLDIGSTVAQALAIAALQGFELPPDACIGVWGKKTALEHVLVEADRVEIYRTLRVDPKVARRLRFAGQGAKSAGLFSTRRAGAKAGY